MLIFIVPALTAFSTVFILFFLIALVSNYTVFSLFSTTVGVVFWSILWFTFQIWIFTPNFKNLFVIYVSKLWLKIWFFANRERSKYKPVYFSNGQIKQEFDNEGNEKEYYENGDLKYIRYKNGNFKEFLSGLILYREFRDGVSTNYDLDGVLEEKSWHDKKDGFISIGYYQSGEVRWEDKNGKRKDYYENGQLISDIKIVSIHYELDGNVKNGVYTEYSNSFGQYCKIDGKKYKDVPINKSIFKNGLLHGTQKTWYDTGILESEIQYKNGLRHGFEKHYNENGELTDLTNYKFDNLFGISRSWFSNGVMESECFYGDDSFPSRQWYENGQLFSEQINDIEKYWDESGNEIEDPYKNINIKNN